MLAYINRPEGEVEPGQTNWSIVPANDNDPEEVADFSFERALLITPSVQEIMRHASEKPLKNEQGKTVRIGGLRFSDGTQTEKAYALGPDGDVIKVDAVMPAGAMLGCREQAQQQTGGKGYSQAQLEQSNLYFAAMLKTIEPRYVKRGKRRNGRSRTAEESRADLEAAWANTNTPPRVTKLAPGLPCGSPRVAESFVGMQKGKMAPSGAMMWQDMCSSIVSREIWDEALAALGSGDKSTLDAATTAKTLQQIGEAHGFRGKRAERMGRTILRAANDNLASALKKSA